MVYLSVVIVLMCDTIILYCQDNDVSASSSRAAEDAEDTEDVDGVEGKRARLDDDDGEVDDNIDMSMSWPHCFSSDRLADHTAVMPFER